jgi:hypothetical protein
MERSIAVLLLHIYVLSLWIIDEVLVAVPLTKLVGSCSGFWYGVYNY